MATKQKEEEIAPNNAIRAQEINIINQTQAKDTINKRQEPVTLNGAKRANAEIVNQNTKEDAIQNNVIVQPKPAENKYNSYADIVADLRKQGESTPEEIAKQEKRAKRYRALALLSDGMSAIGNMVGAVNGAKPFQAKSALNEYGAKYREMLEKRRAESKYWDDMEARGRLMEAKDRFESAKQQKQLENDLAATGAKHGAAINLQELKQKGDMDLLATKNAFATGENTKDRAHETATTRYEQSQSNQRNAANNATHRAIANKSKEDKNTYLVDDDGVEYKIDKKFLELNVGGIYNKIIRDPTIKFNKTPEFQKINAGIMTPEERIDFVKRNFSKSRDAKAFLKSQEKNTNGGSKKFSFTWENNK